MAETKQLVVVVEGTAAMASHWSTIRSNYLDKIIRSFCGEEDPESPIAELALVNIKFHGAHSSCLVQRSSWTKDMDTFLDWLSAIDFSVGGNFCHPGIAEGLAEALMMFQSVHGSQNPERHCILIAASNPYPSPTLVYNPPETGSHFSDAKTVANSFQRCSVSLSVISPNQLSKLREIYNSARRNPSETDPTIGIVKNPNHLILISNDFMDARTALSKPESTNSPSNKSLMNVDVLTNFLHGLLLGRGDPNVSTSPGQAESATRRPTNLVNDNVSTKVGPSSQQTSIALQSKPSEFVQLWKGDLYGEIQGESVFIAKLKCYRDAEASESIAKDWQSTMHIDRLVPQDYVKNKEYTGKVDYVFFKSKSELSILGELREKKLGMVIKLPSQMLLLFVSEKKSWLFGLVIPQETVIYNTPRIKEQPQQGQDSSKGQQSSCIDLNN